MKIKTEKRLNSHLAPVENEVKNLLEMFEFFLTERELGKSIEELSQSVRDMRLIISRILVDHFLSLTPKDEDKFCVALAQMLTDRAALIPNDGEKDGDYFKYCIGEILVSFEYAKEIKGAYSDDSVLQKMLSLDIPILRPFDYGLKGRLKLLKPSKRHRRHSCA